METAGALLRSARRKAGLSQAQLARRAGVTQSVISAYESGARQPSLPSLARLVEATGSGLEIVIGAPRADRDDDRPLARRIGAHRRDILATLDRHGLANPRIFGSVARGEERPGSDIDLLVDIPPGTGLLTLARCQADLEELLGAPVDLVPAADLKAGVAGGVLSEAVPL
jgi:uncharacterized protein